VEVAQRQLELELEREQALGQGLELLLLIQQPLAALPLLVDLELVPEVPQVQLRSDLLVQLRYQSRQCSQLQIMLGRQAARISLKGAAIEQIGPTKHLMLWGVLSQISH
jgi:hypothetical protein